jgi:hypothetical protein
MEQPGTTGATTTQRDAAPQRTDSDQSPPQRNRRTRLIAAAVAAGLALGAVGAVAATQLGGDAEDTVSNTAFDSAHSATEKVAAAFDFALSRSVHLTLEQQGKPATDARIDYANHVVHTSGSTAEYGVADSVIRDGSVYMRFEKGARALGLKPNVWYKSSVTDGPFASTSAVLDPAFLKAYVDAATTVVEAGPVTVDGVDAVRYALTQDKAALADSEAKQFAPGITETALADLRDQLMAGMPDTVEVAVDKSGRLVRIDAGNGNVSRISEIGEAVELPDIDESAVQTLPSP